MPVLSVGLTGTTLVGRNPYRTSINIENRHATAIIYIDVMPPGGITVSNASIRVLPNESCQILEIEDGDMVHEEWGVVSDTAATPVAVFEGWKVAPREAETRGP